MRQVWQKYWPEICVFVGLAALKGLLVAAFGPAFLPDSTGYINFAEQIISGAAWKSHVSVLANPIVATRMIGYPAVLAFCIQVAGSAWPYALIALQSLCSLIAAGFVYLLSRDFGLSRTLALFAVVALATSIQLTLDQCVLTDSLNASAVIVGTCLLARGAPAGRPLPVRQALAGGLFLAIALLIREAMQVLFVTVLPLLAVRWFAAKGKRHALTASLFALVPLAIAIAGYTSWNDHRHGQRFLTVGTGSPMLLTMTYAATYDRTLFAGDTPLQIAARSVPDPDPNDHMRKIEHKLQLEGYGATAIVGMIRTEYARSWRSHPGAMFHVLRNQFSENLLKLSFRPLASICQTAAWASGSDRCPDYRDVLRDARRGFQNASLATTAFLVATTLERIVSIVLTLCFAIGAPVLLIAALRERAPGLLQIALACTALWAMYVGWMCAFSLFQLDVRYLAPVVEIPIVIGLMIAMLAKARHWHPAPSRTAVQSKTGPETRNG